MVIQEMGVKHFNCPICQKPDMSNKDDIQEMYELLFVNMVSCKDMYCTALVILWLIAARSKVVEVTYMYNSIMIRPDQLNKFLHGFARSNFWANRRKKLGGAYVQ